MKASLDAGRPVLVEELPTLADSLGGGIGLDNRLTFAMCRDLLDDVILLSEDEIAAGIRHAYAQEREIVEGAGAVGIAALLAGKVKANGPVVVLLSGRNIDMDAAPQDRLRRGTSTRSTPHEPDDDPHRSRTAHDRDARSRCRRLRRKRLPRARHLAGGDAADPAARHSRASRRGRCEDRLCARHRRLRRQDQPRLLRQSEARPAQRQRHDGAAVGKNRAGRGAAARQWLSDRYPHGRGRRGRGQTSVAAGFRPLPRSSAPACRPDCSSKR